MSVRLPLCTLLVLVLCVSVYQLPHLASLLVFDRHAIGRGELWRMLTGHLVHFSSSHLMADVLAFAVAGGALERLRLSGSIALFMAMPITISTVLLVLDPDMRYYGGMSGLTYGTSTYLALFGLCGSPRYRTAGALVLGAMLLVFALDYFAVGAGDLVSRHQPFRPMPSSHLTGTAVATAVFLWTYWLQGDRDRFGTALLSFK